MVLARYKTISVDKAAVMVAALAKYGADVNRRNADVETPLLLAIKCVPFRADLRGHASFIVSAHRCTLWCLDQIIRVDLLFSWRCKV